MFRKRLFRKLLAILCAFSIALPVIPVEAKEVDIVTYNTEETDTVTYEANAESLSQYSVPEWYRDAKFGIFIHYGVYSVPAFGDEWYGNWMYKKGSLSYGGSDIFNYHLKTYGGASAFGYKDFIDSTLIDENFNTAIKKFSKNNKANEWAQLFSDAGAQYVMPVGIHHDSFALYDSDIQTTYNSVTQAGVDYIQELQDAVKSKGMYFGISNHVSGNDWFFDEANGTGTDMVNPVFQELYGVSGIRTESHIKKWYDISMEIIEKYEPDLIYYDFDLEYDEYSKYENYNKYLMLSNYYNLAQSWGKEVVVNNKLGAFTDSMAVMNKERGALSSIYPAVWQADTSIGQKSWCYTTDDIYRNGDEFIGAIVDIVSKNGNLLLNVGPKADGTIPADVKEALLTIGSWLGTYGDAIYATRPWLIYGEGPTNNSGDNYTYTNKDIRFTKSKDNKRLYATALAAPTSNTMSIETLNAVDYDAGNIAGIKLINGDNRTNLNWSQTDKALNITIPNYKNITTAFSIEITYKDGADITPLATSAENATRTYNYYEADGVTVTTCTDDGSDMIVSKNDGAYTKYLLDLGSTIPSTLVARLSNASSGTIEFRQGGTDGKLLGKMEVSAGTGSGYRTLAATLDLEGITGKLDLCVVYTGNIEISWFKMFNRNLNNIIQAETYDEKEGGVQAEACNDTGGGQNLGYVTAGDMVKYNSVDFEETCAKAFLRLSGFNGGLEIRLDSPNGEVIVKAENINTGSWSAYSTYDYDLNGITGVHDIYIIFTGVLNLNWFSFGDENYYPPIVTDSGDKTRAAAFYNSDGIEITMQSGNEIVVNNKDGAYTKYLQNFDTAKANTFMANISGDSEGRIEIRDGGPGGTLLSVLTVNKDTGKDFRVLAADIDLAKLGDSIDLCLVYYGKIELEWFIMVNRGFNIRIEAESYDAKSGTAAAESTSDNDGGRNIGWVSTGDWLRYSNVDLTDCTSITMRLAGLGGGLEVRIDSPTGKIIAAFSSVNTGSWSTYQSHEKEITGVSGTHDIYIKFTNSLNLNWFMLGNKKITVNPTSVKLSKPSVALNKGDTYKLTATVLPANAANKTITWTTSNPNIATVTGGTVKAVGKGPATITAKTSNGKTASCKVTVNVPATKVKISKSKITLGVKEKYTLSVSVTPKNSTDTLTYNSDKKSIVSVSKKGVITAKKTGKATVTVKSTSGVKSEIKVTVKAAPKKITVKKTSISLKRNATFKINYSLTKNSASYQVTYKSSKKSVASVNKSGKITAKKKGTAKITVKTFNGKTVRLTVIVN